MRLPYPGSGQLVGLLHNGDLFFRQPIKLVDNLINQAVGGFDASNQLATAKSIPASISNPIPSSITGIW